jgi:flagellar biosynthesis protein
MSGPERDPALAGALARLELEQEIPPELFAAVAEVLAWASSLEPKLGREAAGDPG